MKRLLSMFIATALGATASVAMATSGSLVQFKPKVMPVVVWVNSQGQVTDISPSQRLRPKVRDLLLKQIDAWIVKPAEVKGRPVASQFIINVAFNATPNKDGDYDAGFVYVDSMAMPFYGPVTWDHINGDLELALVPANDMAPRHEWRVRYNPVGYFANSAAARGASHAIRHTENGSRPVPSTVSTPSRALSDLRARPAPSQPAAAMRTFVAPHFVPTISTGTSRSNASNGVVHIKHP